MSQNRQLAAIMFTDIVGYTALMQKDEQGALEKINRFKQVLESITAQHNGKIIQYYGDGCLLLFNSAVDAVNHARLLQQEFGSEPSIPVRIGVHLGDVVLNEGNVYGDGVNVASRIQSLGQANSILFSAEVWDKIKNNIGFQSASLGKFEFKNVSNLIEVFALTNGGLCVPKRNKMEGKLKKKNFQNRNVIATLSFILLVVTAFFIYKKSFPKKDNAEIDKSIAILPFRNMSSDTRQEYFAEGMMDEILNHLYKIGGLSVISSTSSMTYKGTKKTSKEIADELGVGNLLEGSVQTEGDRIRIIVQLINGKTDQHLWAETYNREFKDVFFIQSDIAQRIAAALKVKIDPETKSRIEYIPTKDTGAYNLYLQSKRKIFNTGWKELLEKVIRLDSSFAPAYADLAWYWFNRGSVSYSEGDDGDLNAKQASDSAFSLLRKAIQLDSNLASAHQYMAMANLRYKWDFNAAKQEWEKFFQLNPSGIYWEGSYIEFLQCSGRFREALDFSLKNRDNDKNNWVNWINLAFSYYHMNQLDKVLVILDSTSMLNPGTNKYIYMYRAWLFIYLGKYQEVIANLDKYFEMFPKDRKVPRMQAWLAISNFHTGRMNEVKKIVDSLEFLSTKLHAGSPSFYVAAIYAATNRTELALQWLDKAYKHHEVEMYWLKEEPLFKSLQNDARFKELLSKIGFP